MRKAPLLGVAVLSLWPTLVQATDASNFTLKTTEDLLGLPLLGAAASSPTSDMCKPFGLCP